MKTVEVSGRTLEEAVQIAAQQLEVGVDDVEYEVVEEGTKGFLGLGQTPTLIKARIREGYKEKAKSAQVEEQAAEVEETEAVPAEEAHEEAVPAAEGGQSVDRVMSLLEEMMSAMDVDAKPVLRSVNSDEIQINLVGKDVAILIGKHGQTLDALQYLMGIVINRDPEERRRLIIDAEGYRERHQQMLERKAREYAKAVAAEGKEAVLEPQAARDRRIVHLALADHPDVYTYSEGEGEDRHVVISPKVQ